MEKPNLNVEDKSTIVDQEPIKQKFIETLVRIHKLSKDDAESYFEREATYYKKALHGDKNLAEATGISLVSAFFEIAINKLSIQPGYQSLARIAQRSAKVNQQVDDGKGNKAMKEVWIKNAYFEISAYGERDMRINSGQMKYMSNPIVLWEGDHFQPKTDVRGVLMVDYAPAIPRKSKTIFGAWCSITRMDGSLDFKWILVEEIDRLEKYSIPKATTFNPSPKANALYSSFEGGQIDPGFLETKCMKHAMKALPKLKTSDNVAFEGSEAEQEVPQTFAADQGKVAAVKITQPKEENEDGVF